MRKKRAVSSKGKSLSLVNLVTWWRESQGAKQEVASSSSRNTETSDRQCDWDIKEMALRQSEQRWKGYKSSHDSSGHSESKGSTEDTQEDAKGFQQGHGLKAVAVVSSRLVCHDRAEYTGTNTLCEKRKQVFTKNPVKGKWLTVKYMLTLTRKFWKCGQALSQTCSNPNPRMADSTSRLILCRFRGFLVTPLKIVIKS